MIAELAAFDIGESDTKLKLRVPLAREPRAVIATPRGRAVVSHAGAEPLSLVTFDGSTAHVQRLGLAGRAHPASQRFTLAMVEGEILALQVESDPEKPITYYGSNADADRLDDRRGQARGPRTRRIHASLPLAARSRRPSCSGPSPAVACMGDDVLLEYAGEWSAPKRKWTLPGGVTGLAVDPTRRSVVGWAQHSRSLVVLDLIRRPTDVLVDATSRPPTIIAATGDSLVPEEVRRGRAIFHDASSINLSADGRACARGLRADHGMQL